MDLKGGKLKENLSFSSYIMIVCILIVVPVLLYISFSDYTVLERNFKDNYYQLQNNTEDSIIESIKIANTGLEIFDKTFDYRMNEAFIPFIKAYNNSGGRPENIDLYAIKSKLGEEYDLYIIDKQHVVKYSTKESDLGLNFSSMENFSGQLDRILSSGVFSGDRIVRGVRDSGNVSKYAYYPSTDGEYILELSYIIEDYSILRNRLHFSRTADSLKDMNPYLTSIKIYDIYGQTIGKPDIPKTLEETNLIKKVIREKKDYTNYDSGTNTIERLRYCDLFNPETGSDPSVVLAFTYSNEAIQKELNKILFSKVVTFFLLLILLLVVFYLATDIVTRPIKYLVEDVDEIAKGNLDHKIRTKGGREFSELRISITNMVSQLKKMIDELLKSEEIIKKQNEDLEDIIEKRTDDLKKANDEANFYLDLMMHDINNANMAALGYAQFIEEVSDETIKDLASKITASISKSSDIISNVSLIRTIHSRDRQIKPVSLDAAVNSEIIHHPDLDIEYENTGFYVEADELINEVFSNLIGNSQKYAGSDCKINITAEEKEGEILICIDDNGPGISDEAKSDVFSRAYREKCKKGKSGKGLGLYIVKVLVEKRYGGSIYAADRVENNHEMGLKICIILKKAENHLIN